MKIKDGILVDVPILRPFQSNNTNHNDTIIREKKDRQTQLNSVVDDN